MIISAYFYNWFFSTTPVKQYFLDLQQTAIETKDDLTSFGSCTFSLPLDADVDVGQKVVIYEQKNDTTIQIFSGYLYMIEPILDVANRIIQCTVYDEKHFLTKKKVLADNDFTTQPLSSILSVLATTYNTLGDGWVIDCDVMDASLTYKAGDSFFDAFNDLAEWLKLQWTVRNGVVIMKSRIGLDRTFGPSFTEAIYSNNESNISEVAIKIEDNRVDLVIVNYGDGWLVSQYPLTNPNPCESVRYITTRSRDVDIVAQSIYDNNQTPFIQYNFTLQQDSLRASIGDLIQFRIQDFGKYDFTGSTNIISKTTSYTNGVKIETIGVSERVAQAKNFTGIIRNIQRDINLMKLGV